MSKEATNVELDNNMIEVTVGEIIADPENAKTIIPPKASGRKDSPENEETVVIKLGGKWPPERDADKAFEPGE